MGTLSLVATPIGNLEDASPRALRVIAEADLFFAEDTRRARILLDRFDIKAHAHSLHEHNEASRVEKALSCLGEGGRVALVSDAGTPLISDPGGRLVEAVVAAGHDVEAIPGPSAVLSALAVSGLAAAPFTFIGFLPRRQGACRELLASYRGRPETLVVFESPRRVGATLALLAEVLGDRRACVARELTKLHEEVVRGSLSELAEVFSESARGEITLVVAGDESGWIPGPAEIELTDEELTEKIHALLAEGRRPREIAAQLASQTKVPRRRLYARVLAAKEES
jgi:16S rRNA (cytidine1402-2'-O)-methyltransferase